MDDFQAGDLVYAPDPDSAGLVEATFVAIADPDEAIEVPVEGGSTRKADAAYVEWEDGTVSRVIYAKLRPLSNDDPRRRLRRLDGCMLATLDSSGTSDKREFLKVAVGARPAGDWDVPSDKAEAERWLNDAEQRGLLRTEDEEGFLSITAEGRDRLRMLV